MSHLYQCRDMEEAAEGFCDLAGMLTAMASPMQVSGTKHCGGYGIWASADIR